MLWMQDLIVVRVQYSSQQPEVVRNLTLAGRRTTVHNGVLKAWQDER
jgi:DNA-binding HxlR family transcriptional regulator